MNWTFITFFGDSTLLLPSGVILCICLLWLSPRKEVAGQWAMLFCLVGLIVCASKLAFMGWGIGNRTLDFTGFSGHSSLSATFWPVMLWMLSGRFSAKVRRSAVIAGYLLAALIGFSRLMVHAHSVSEVLAGLTLGYLASSTFLYWQHHGRGISLSWTQLAAILILPLFLVNAGAKAPTTSILERIAVKIGPYPRAFTRLDLHRRAGLPGDPGFSVQNLMPHPQRQHIKGMHTQADQQPALQIPYAPAPHLTVDSKPAQGELL